MYHTGPAIPANRPGQPAQLFKVWACGTGEYESELRLVRSILDDISPRMTQAPPAGMGNPVPDTGTSDAGGDNRIDVYLLEPGQYFDRNGQRREIDAGTLAQVTPADPFSSGTASSFIMVNREAARTNGISDLRRSLIHEFFHSLQYAHNYQIKEVRPNEGFWFYEATAAWAEWNYFREDSRPVHDYFIKDFKQRPEMMLEEPVVDEPVNLHGYAAYIWPFFMQQQGGGSPASIFQAWVSARGARTWEQMAAAIDQQLPFKDSFKEFAVRNLNTALEPGNPVSPRYVALDPNFPDGERPYLANDVALAEAEVKTISPYGGALQPLAAQYDHFVVPDEAGKVTFNFEGLSPRERIDIVALLKVGGTWRRQDVGPDEDLTFCRDRAGEDLQEAFVVLANHARVTDWVNRQANAVKGNYTVRTDDSCQTDYQATGTITWKLHHDYKFVDPNGATYTVTKAGEATLNLRFTRPYWSGYWRIDPSSSSYVYNFTEDRVGPSGSIHLRLHGSSTYGADDHILDPKLWGGQEPPKTHLLFHLFGEASGYVEETNASGTSRRDISSSSFGTACPDRLPGTGIAGVTVEDGDGDPNTLNVDFACNDSKDLGGGGGSGTQTITARGVLRVEPM